MNSDAIHCPRCNTLLEPTDRVRTLECPRCHETLYLKPTEDDCKKLVTALKTQSAEDEIWAQFHKLWGLAHDHNYQKVEWGKFQNMLVKQLLTS